MDKSAYIKIPNTHEAIISRELFELTQQLMSSRKRNVLNLVHISFTNFLFCSDCGSGMWFRSNRKGYLCGSYSKHGRIACSHHHVTEKQLIMTMLHKLNEAVERLKHDKDQSSQHKPSPKELKNLNKQLVEVEQSLLSITEKKLKYLGLLSEDVLTHIEYREAMDSLHEETLLLNLKKSELNRSLQLLESESHIAAHVHAFLAQAPFKKVTKKLLATFVKRIDVKENGEFTIQFHSPFI